LGGQKLQCKKPGSGIVEEMSASAPEPTLRMRCFTKYQFAQRPHPLEFDFVKSARHSIFLIFLVASGTCVAASQENNTYFLQLPLNKTKSLGQIDRLVVTVACGWISGLRNVPDLYDVNMSYDIPSENVLDAEPRLGAAAVELSRWNGVVGVHLPSDADSKSCFKVTVTAEGRSGEKAEWSGSQLGLPK
jgi:hypothetical protein